jgi:uncharacterized lipoprotein
MKKSAFALAGILAVIFVVGCSSKAKRDEANNRVNSDTTVSGATTPPAAPVDLGASSSGRGL